jgi:hypothetical protein
MPRGSKSSSNSSLDAKRDLAAAMARFIARFRPSVAGLLRCADAAEAAGISKEHLIAGLRDSSCWDAVLKHLPVGSIEKTGGARGKEYTLKVCPIKKAALKDVAEAKISEEILRAMKPSEDQVISSGNDYLLSSSGGPDSLDRAREQRFFASFQHVIGVDEAGRGELSQSVAANLRY